MRISVIGSGFVGTAVGKGFMKMGNEVIFYDIVEKDLPKFTTNLDDAIANTDISFICVPTPTDKEGRLKLDIIRKVAQDTGIALSRMYLVPSKKYHVIVIKSTVVPTTTEEVLIPEIEKFSISLKAGKDFGVCVNPEFITEIENSWTDEKDYRRDFFTEDRIVIGEYDKKSGDILEELYEPLGKQISRTDLRTAEMIKYASNCILATKISYWNELFLISKELGIDSQKVADIVSLDPRIGKYGALHGKAFGGKCLPKDIKAFVSFAEKYHNTKLLKAVDDINEEMKKKYGVRE